MKYFLFLALILGGCVEEPPPPVTEKPREETMDEYMERYHKHLAEDDSPIAVRRRARESAAQKEWYRVYYFYLNEMHYSHDEALVKANQVSSCP